MILALREGGSKASLPVELGGATPMIQHKGPGPAAEQKSHPEGGQSFSATSTAATQR